MMILPKHKERYEQLITRCVDGISVNGWWILGEEMHTLSDDYIHLYDYNAAKTEFEIMWEKWESVDPRVNKVG